MREYRLGKTVTKLGQDKLFIFSHYERFSLTRSRHKTDMSNQFAQNLSIRVLETETHHG